MIRSMTGFASAKGAHGAHSWTWELRSVNAKGLDLRLRVPEWLEGLEPAIRKDLGKAAARGNITLSLRLTRSDDAGGLAVNSANLDAVVSALSEIEAVAMERGVTLAPSTASDLLAMRGVLEASAGEEDIAELVTQLKTDLAPLIASFLDMRAGEGTALFGVLQKQLDTVETLTAKATEVAEARRTQSADVLRTNLARVLDNAGTADPDRVAQELALIAVKADVTEELDRLGAHIAAARDLLETGGAVGRKLDFLMQEFNREANTLCSKAQSTELTAVGLELKALIDQMREQVQNVE